MSSPVTITPDPWSVYEVKPTETKPVEDRWAKYATNTPPLPPGYTIDDPWKVVSQTPTNEVHAEISAREGGVRGWLQDLSDDIKYGNTNTVVGKALKMMGAQPTRSGVSEGAADFMASPVLGTSRAAQGGISMAEGAAKRDAGQAWRGAKDVVGGVMDAAQIPASFVAPEVGEAAQLGGEQVAQVAKRGAQAVKDGILVPEMLSPSKVARGTAEDLLSALDKVATDSGLTASKATSASGKVADLVTELKGKAKTIYSTLDEASGGRFQRFKDEISDLEHYLDNATNVKDATELKAQIADATERFESVKSTMARAGVVDPADLAQADRWWSQAKALETVGKKFRNAETLSGELKSTPAVLDNAVKNIDAVRPQTLERAVGADNAKVIRSRVVGNTKAVAAATRNRKLAGNAAKAIGAGGAGAALLRILGGDSK